MRRFKIGDRVQVYGRMDEIDFNGQRGTIVKIDKSYMGRPDTAVIHFDYKFIKNLHSGGSHWCHLCKKLTGNRVYIHYYVYPELIQYGISHKVGRLRKACVWQEVKRTK